MSILLTRICMTLRLPRGVRKGIAVTLATNMTEGRNSNYTLDTNDIHGGR